jgi:nucleoside-triphosphatase THEP1
MQIAHPDLPITAIVYPKGPDFEAFLRDVTATMAEQGMRLAGLVQHSQAKPGRTKCDMYLQDLTTGEVSAISDDRGPHARGCVMNTDRLLGACEAAKAGLSAETDLMVLCKFGKAEVEGGGFRSLIAEALELSVPVLIGVPEINLSPFREFASGFAREIEFAELACDQRLAAADRLRSAFRPAGWAPMAVA